LLERKLIIILLIDLHYAICVTFGNPDF